MMHLIERTGLPFEPFDVRHLTDARGRYRLDLDPEFPLAIKLYDFGKAQEFPLNWHERLELFVPLAGSGRFRMGDCLVAFSPGDVLVVDNLQMHGLVEFHGRRKLGMTVTFDAELICTPGSRLCDSLYLIPFNRRGGRSEPVIRASEPTAMPLHDALGRLVDCYFDGALGLYSHAGCKAYLLAVLYHVAQYFQAAEVGRGEYLKQQERARRLARLFDHLQHSFARPIGVPEAASLVGMSQSSFMKCFKQSTGTTFVNYLTQLRLNMAYRLLRETTLPIAAIADQVGIPDPAYFDRKFKQQFKMSPRAMRSREYS